MGLIFLASFCLDDTQELNICVNPESAIDIIFM